MENVEENGRKIKNRRINFFIFKNSMFYANEKIMQSL